MEPLTEVLVLFFGAWHLRFRLLPNGSRVRSPHRGLALGVRFLIESQSSMSVASTKSAFPETRWTQVVAAVQEDSVGAEEAIEAVCRAYWFPLYAFARRSGHSPHDAQDLTQDFFHRVLEKRWLAAADRQKGRLRTFLIDAMKKHMANQWRARSAQRRGGHVSHVAFDVDLAETRYTHQGGEAVSAGEIFDRQWALNLLELTLARMKTEYVQAGKGAEFEVLKPWLTVVRGKIDYPTLAEKLQTSAGAARVAVHRLRKRFREVYRQEVAQTLAPDANLDEELVYLARVLAGSPSEDFS